MSNFFDLENYPFNTYIHHILKQLTAETNIKIIYKYKNSINSVPIVTTAAHVYLKQI